MKDDGLVVMGVFLLAVTVVFLTVAPGGRASGAGASGAAEVPWGFLVLLGVFAFVGRRWFLARRTHKRTPRAWKRRRRALPPAPEPRDRAPGP